MKQTHELRAGYGIWELATETEDVIRLLQSENLDISHIHFYLKEVYHETEDIYPGTPTLRRYQVFWRPVPGYIIPPATERRLQELMPSRPAESRSDEPLKEWEAIYQYVLLRIMKGVPA